MIRLRVENLGRVQSADVDVRPLTVFVGRNDTNKSWMSYLLHHAAEGLSAEGGARMGRPSVAHDVSEFVRHLKEGVDGTRISMRARSERARWSSNWDESDQHALAGLLRVDPGSIRDLVVEYEVEVPPGEHPVDSIQIEAERSSAETATTITSVVFRGKPLAVRPLHVEMGTFGLVQIPEMEAFLFRESSRAAAAFVRSVLFPVERVAWDPGAGRHSRDPGALGKLSELMVRVRARSVPGGVDLATMVGRGRVHVTAETASFTPDGKAHVPLAASASLVRSLAPLVLYVETLGRPGDFIVIDEPEMNAHPQAQLRIMEYLASLANRGVHVVITTHSPYLVEHLMNLMEASRHPSDLARMQATHGLDPAAAIDPERVAVYEFVDVGDHVEVRDVLDRAGATVDSDTHSAVTNAMGRLFDDLLSAK